MRSRTNVSEIGLGEWPGISQNGRRQAPPARCVPTIHAPWSMVGRAGRGKFWHSVAFGGRKTALKKRSAPQCGGRPSPLRFCRRVRAQGVARGQSALGDCRSAITPASQTEPEPRGAFRTEPPRLEALYNWRRIATRGQNQVRVAHPYLRARGSRSHPINNISSPKNSPRPTDPLITHPAARISPQSRLRACTAPSPRTQIFSRRGL